METRIKEYAEHLERKKKRPKEWGFSVDESTLNTQMFAFQKYCVKRAIETGRFALFEDCGLGKTFQQLEWCKQVCDREQRPVIILTPLAVSGQTIKEAEKFGYSIERLKDDAFLSPKIYITNYEQLDNIDASLFCGVALDESSILKNFEGKMRNSLMERFVNTPYKSCWTATPSPNDPMELGNHSEFLGVMSRNEMLSMYFVHDGGDTSKWRIKGHAEKDFWQWVSTWAIMISKPSDIGFDDTGYILPELNMIENIIETHKRDNGMLFNDIAVNATNFNKELRLTLVDRLSNVADIVNNSSENFIIWIKQDMEGEYLRKIIPGAVEVKGSDKPDVKESRLLGFANNEFRVLITKAKIAQYGLNYQNCHNQIFASLDFSFESLYQAIRRSLRFGQKHTVNIYIITTDTMQNVIANIKEKQKKFHSMQRHMVDAMRNIFTFREKKEQNQIEFKLPTFLKVS
ncbi:helicase [Dysgonomonas sp. 521]|uniref:DEAD/DEAH box helicase n=1 Tax=Dysgonomonas sp. 521 TaxID=2302932 RepID=UPI0013D07F60|nr:DEAD/DEAH box helicase [Dysgonomonas sp. 521]NDV93500.1 helicase [Dysgonomonas sp. 521]